ncbi:hypothetical protein RRG08_013839 [Elysia crispata]|uniref:Fibrinogen C-terminal domain-containing protein n=1 Tax=Elysia crispata TaxID=231223 RepID=A0AAE0YX19_9GAST|nr:hypothetical protein RRG08_013839 [Elysia crispata]
MMKTVFTFICFLNVVSRLELSLDFSTLSSLGHRGVCGILTCEAIFKDDTNNMSTESTSNHSTISNMSIFKEGQSSSAGEDGSSSQAKYLITTLSVEQPKISRACNGIKVDGFLETGQAKLRLEMVKEANCFAVYSCEVRTSDSQGNKVVHTNRLHQRSEIRKSQARSTAMAPKVLLQQLALLQQQMSFMGASLDSEFKGVESRLNILQNRIEDKIETRVVDKLCEVERKLPVNEADRNEIPRRLNEVIEGLKTYREDIKHENERVIKLNALVVSNSTRNLDFGAEKRDDLIAENQTVVNSSEGLGYRLQNDFSALQINLHTDFKKLKEDMLNTSSETLSAVRHLISDTNSTMWNSLKPVVLDILIPTDCKKGMLLGTACPYHVIPPNENSNLDVSLLCDSVTAGGGWIVIQRRVSGGVGFYRNWAAYKEGFGSLDDEFWWGNEKIHALTSSGKYELRVDLKYKGKSSFAHYSSFSLDGESNNYVLRLGAYDGTAGDSLSHHNGKPFSTYDRDNDGSSANYAVEYLGAWWYFNNYYSNLNGKWSIINEYKGATWYSLSGYDSISFSEIKIRKL